MESPKIEKTINIGQIIGIAITLLITFFYSPFEVMFPNNLTKLVMGVSSFFSISKKFRLWIQANLLKVPYGERLFWGLEILVIFLVMSFGIWRIIRYFVFWVLNYVNLPVINIISTVLAIIVLSIWYIYWHRLFKIQEK